MPTVIAESVMIKQVKSELRWGKESIDPAKPKSVL